MKDLYLKSLLIDNFRNLSTTRLNFESGINVFVGQNAQGKTNLLEAIAVLSTGSSNRTNLDQDLIKWGKNYFFLEAAIDDQAGLEKISIGYQRNNKKIKINNVLCSRIKDLIGSLPLVYFSPEDLNLIKGSPEIRRKFIDNQLCQAFPLYYDYLIRYRNLLQQRNNFLKKNQNQAQKNIEPWDIQLAETGAFLSIKRKNFIKEITPLAKDYYQSIAEADGNLKIEYSPRLKVGSDDKKDWEVAIFEALKRNRNKDFLNRQTSVGPHRDEVLLYLDNKLLRNFGSQGQQRTAALTLKIAECDYISQVKQRKALLLLDDVFSELDSKRQQALLKIIRGNMQTFITTTDKLFATPKLAHRSFKVLKGEFFLETRDE